MKIENIPVVTVKFQETKKWPKKARFQNIQLITCKDDLAEPLFMRVSEGYRRNESYPNQDIDTFEPHIKVRVSHHVEMKVIRIRILTQK